MSALNQINSSNSFAINNWASKLVDPMYIQDVVDVDDTMVDNKTSNECGYFWVEDEEAARLVIERALGMEEHVLYDDEVSPRTNSVDTDILAQVIELQVRMEKGMEMINEMTTTRDVLREEYYGLKTRIEKGFNIIKEEQDYSKKKMYRQFMTKLVDQKNSIGSQLGAVNDRLSTLWNHWKNLKDQCSSIIGNDKMIWVEFFRIKEEIGLNEWMDAYYNDEHLPRGREWVYSDPTTDNRMLVSHEAYCVSHYECGDNN